MLMRSVTLRRAAGRAAVAAFCIITPLIWWSWKLGPMRTGEPMRFVTHDQFEYTVPALTYGTGMLRRGIVPLWDPYQLCGTPFLAAQQPGVFYPPNWLALVLPVPETLRVLMIAHYILAMAGAYWCARIFGVSRPAALVAGVGYAFSGTLYNNGVDRMQTTLASAAWLPLQLALTGRILSTGKMWPAVGLAAATAMNFLGGHPQYVLMSALLCGGYAGVYLVWLARRDGLRAVLRRGALLTLAAGIALGLSAPQLLPTVQLMRESPRRPQALARVGANDEFPFWFSSLALPQNMLGPMGMFGYAGEGYLATAVLGLTPIPLLWRVTRQRALFLWMVAVGAALLALGDNGPVYHWYLHIPGANLFRYPERFMVVTTLALAVLAAIGADTLRRLERPSCVAFSMATGIALMVGLSWLGWRAPGPMLAALVKRQGYIALFVIWGACFTIPGGRWRTLRWRALMVLGAVGSVVEVYHAIQMQRSLPVNQPDGLQIPYGAVAFIRRQPPLARTFAPNPPFRLASGPHLPLKLGMLTGLPVISDYETLFEHRYAALLEQLGGEQRAPASGYQGPRVASLGPRQWPLLRVLGVEFILVRRDAEISVALPDPVYSDAEYAVFELAEPVPRAFVATNVRVEPDPERVLFMLAQDTGFVLSHGAILENAVAVDGDATGRVAITRYTPHVVELQAQLSRRGLVVLHDQFDSNWRATVDGRPAPILRTNYVFRGVPVDAGSHVVRFEYRPLPFYVGGVMALMTFAGLLVSAVAAVRRACQCQSGVALGVASARADSARCEEVSGSNG